MTGCCDSAGGSRNLEVEYRRGGDLNSIAQMQRIHVIGPSIGLS
jgi:hypothetical protein